MLVKTDVSVVRAIADKGRALSPEPVYKFRCNMLGIGGAASVSENHYFMPGRKAGYHHIRGFQYEIRICS